MAKIVKVKWPRNDVFSAELVKAEDDGSLTMRTRSQGKRVASGVIVSVQPSELLESLED